MIFVGLTAHSRHYILTKSTDQAGLTDAVVRGKRVWERNACFDCHTLHGEGARFAPEVGDVFKRWGGEKDPAGAHQMIKDWMKSQPSGAEGRRQMPQLPSDRSPARRPRRLSRVGFPHQHPGLAAAPQGQLSIPERH